MKKKLIAGLMLGMALVTSSCGSKVPGLTAGNQEAEDSASAQDADSSDDSNWVDAIGNDTKKEAAEEAVEETPEDSMKALGEEPVAEEPVEEAPVDEGTEPATDENVEKSPAALWGYTGYVDECLEYYWRDDFVNQDYDEDGKTDRLYRTYRNDPESADYVIEFGNGNKLEINGVWDTGFPHIQMADLNSDGEKDVLFTLSYDTSTDPMAFGNMLVCEYDSASQSYKEAALPFDDSGEVAGCALLVDYGTPTDDGKIDFEIKKAGYSGTVLAGADYVESFWIKEALSETRSVYEASIEDYQGTKAIHCNMEILPKFGSGVSFYLVNENGAYVIKDMTGSDDSIQGKASDNSVDNAQVKGQTPENNEKPMALAATSGGGGHIVVIDPGHQSRGISEKEPNGPGSSTMKAKVTGGTSGVASGLSEFQLTLTIGLKLRDELVNRGYTVVMTRESNDVSLSNIERVQIANNAGAEAFVRIHANGSNDSSVNGAMTICQTASNPYNAAYYAQSRKLSDCVLDAYVAATGFKKQYVWETDTMTGINWANVPSTIIEMGYMSNATDDANMSNETMQQQMVIGIANGIDNYFAQ